MVAHRRTCKFAASPQRWIERRSNAENSMDYLPIFVGVTAAAVVIQAGILVALFVAVKKSTSRMEALATEVKTKVMPTVDTAQSLLVEWRPKIDTIASNVSETTTVVRGQVERLDATVTDIVDRTRLQVIRADELLNRTMDRIEETSDAVHRTVISPVRQLSGIIQGLTAGLEFLLGGERRRRHDVSVPQDEMFI
jgi:HAMP domain-containing protein